MITISGLHTATVKQYFDIKLLQTIDQSLLQYFRNYVFTLQYARSIKFFKVPLVQNAQNG